MSYRFFTEADIKRDESQRRVHVEELVRIAVQWGWSMGRSGEDKPRVDLWWDEDGHAHVKTTRQPRQPLLRRILGKPKGKPWAVRGDCTWQQHETHVALHASRGDMRDPCPWHILVSQVRFRTQQEAQESCDRRNLGWEGDRSNQPIWRPILAVNAHERRWIS